MSNRLLSAPPDGGASAAELALAESIAAAFATTAQVWEPDNPQDPQNACWNYCRTVPDETADSSAPIPPSDLLAKAALCDRPLTTRTDDGRPTVAMRLGSESGRFLVARPDLPTEDLLETVCVTLASAHRATRTVVELQTENDSFAEQLSSDLEELTFLRSMVERVSAVRANDELVGMARHTLPVLNETVHARCLALMTLSDPDEPHEAMVAYATGEGTLPSETLTEIVKRFAPQASDGPLVRNWEAVGLPGSARVGDDDRLPGVNSIVLAPVVAGKQRFGWLVAANREPQGESLAHSWQLASDEFGSGEGSLIATTSSILATHAANLDLVREKEQILISVVRSLVSAIEAKDPYTRGHSERVALFTRRLAEEVGYFETEAEAIYLSALLHDVGKIGVSDATLKKEGKLTDEEYAEISKHPDEGWAILCDLEQLRHVLPGVLHHHERWDGRGYPDGLAGEEIPLDGRVMAVADAYDAMTSDRPYRKGMPTEKAESILRSGAGEQWDPNCVDAFFACLDDLHAIKADYQQRERRQRLVPRDADEPLELPHEVAGLAE